MANYSILLSNIVSSHRIVQENGIFDLCVQELRRDSHRNAKENLTRCVRKITSLADIYVQELRREDAKEARQGSGTHSRGV